MKLPLPTETERLRLRLFTMSDAPTVQRLAGDWEVAKTTLNIPHPYEDGMAEAWIATHQEGMASGAIHLAVTLKDGQLIGAMGLGMNRAHHWAELGYWIGRRYWGQGYATEAARAVIELGFRHLKLNRIQARHMTGNPASGRVMQKCGMTYEGTLRQAVFGNCTYYDLAVYSILRSEFRA